MKVLMTGYQLWGGRSRTPVDELAALLRMPPAALRVVIERLAADGLVAVHAGGEQVALTAAGASVLALEPPSPPQ